MKFLAVLSIMGWGLAFIRVNILKFIYTAILILLRHKEMRRQYIMHAGWPLACVSCRRLLVFNRTKLRGFYFISKRFLNIKTFLRSNYSILVNLERAAVILMLLFSELCSGLLKIGLIYIRCRPWNVLWHIAHAPASIWYRSKSLQKTLPDSLLTCSHLTHLPGPYFLAELISKIRYQFFLLLNFIIILLEHLLCPIQVRGHPSVLFF